MAYTNTLRFARTSPRKARLVTDMIRGKSWAEARTILQFSKRRAATMVLKALEAAAANAENEGELNPRSLQVIEARVDEGPTMKRFQPKDRGRAFPIMKRTSHIVVSVDER